MRRRLFIILVCVLIAAGVVCAQGTQYDRIQLTPGSSIIQNYAVSSAGNILAGNIVKISSGTTTISGVPYQNVTIVAAGAATGALGVAVSSASVGNLIPVAIAGQVPTATDNACTSGNAIFISTTTPADGHCATTGNSELIGYALATTGGAGNVLAAMVTSGGVTVPGSSGQVIFNNGGQFGALTLAGNSDYPCQLGGVISDCTPGQAVDNVAATTYTEVQGDLGHLKRLSGGAATAVSLPIASSLTTGFYSSWRCETSTSVTFTPTTSLINSASTALCPANWVAYINSDFQGVGNGAYWANILPTIAAFPDCHTSGTSALIFTASTGVIGCNAISGGGGSVSQITGDGSLITNSASSGAVTLTVGTANAHKFWGNNTGSPATASFVQLACADLSNAATSCSTDATNANNISAGTLANARLAGSGSTTVNGATCTVGSTCTPSAHVLCAKFSTTDTFTANGGTRTFATTCTIPANTLTTNTVLRVSIGGTFTTSGAPPANTWNLLAGATPIFTSGSFTPGASVTGAGAGSQFYLQGTASPGASVNVVTNPMAQSSSIWMGASILGNTVGQPVALATNGSIILSVTWVTGASDASTSMTLNQFIVEQVN